MPSMLPSKLQESFMASCLRHVTKHIAQRLCGRMSVPEGAFLHALNQADEPMLCLCAPVWHLLHAGLTSAL